MNPIDEKFKERHPSQTVAKIRNILEDLGIRIEETWNDSGLDHCHSLIIRANGRAPYANGKGITRELAQASAYGEFMERLQSGLFLYKYQSINRDPAINLHTYAPDARYMTLEELEENGEWMDPIIAAYGSGLTRKKLAQQCQMYACTDGKILTMPFYSLFEDKYVYLPAGFVEQLYSANGCCVGNSKEEAWIHALSEIMERKGSISLLTGGKSGVKIPEEVLAQFPTVMQILSQIRSTGKYDVDVFDTSIGNGHPIITTRIINKEDHTYVVNTGSDPVFEIAVHRTLTEIFQGKNIENFTSFHNGALLGKVTDMPLACNIMNLLETGNGNFTYDFFTEELDDTRTFQGFADNSNKSNAELLQIMLNLYRELNLPVYVRNYSFLGFHCYKFVVPGFSESRGMRLTEPYQEYILADSAARTFRDPLSASAAELQLLLSFHKQMQSILSRKSNFAYLSGVPVSIPGMVYLTLSYAAYILGRYNEAIGYLNNVIGSKAIDDDTKEYLRCLARYISMKQAQRPDAQIRLILHKFYQKKHADMLYDRLDNGRSPYDGLLMKCDYVSCERCPYRDKCNYHSIRDIIARAGGVYNKFTEGQARENFTF